MSKKHRHLKYNFYYGIPHAHTSYSTGKGTPYEAFKYAKEKELDFLIITDHSKDLDGNVKFKDKEGSKWIVTKKEAERFIKRHDNFLPLRGFEAYTSMLGDINIIGSEDFIKDKIRNFKELEAWLKKQPSPILTINHPEHFIEKLDYIPEMDQFINFIEVGNGSPPHKYTRYEKCYFSLLDKGWHIGAMNGQDNHRENWGNTDNLTVIVCDELDKPSLMSALRERRTYSTETRTLKLLVKANECFMGGILKSEANCKISFIIEAEDIGVPIKKIQIISNGGKVIQEQRFPYLKDIKWQLQVEPKELPTWYVIKTTHVGEKYGISSPIFVE